MTEEKKTTRRDLMRPVQLLGLAFGAAIFAGVVTAVAMGVFQSRFPDQAQRALTLAAVVTGITFIVVLVGLALMILAVDPAEVTKTIDRPVLRGADVGAPSTAAPDAPTADAGPSDAEKPDAAASGDAQPEA